MNAKRKTNQSLANDSEVTAERAYLKALSDRRDLSLSKMVEVLKNISGLNSPSKSAISRLIDPVFPISSMSPRKREKILKVAAAIRASLDAPLRITAGVVANSTDALPVHLLGARETLLNANKSLSKMLLREIQRIPMQGASVRVVPMDSIKLLMEALESADNPLDFIVAPRVPNDVHKECVKRLFKITQVQVVGLFPSLRKTEHAPEASSADVAYHLEEMKQKRGCIGVVANGGFDASLRQFTERHSGGDEKSEKEAILKIEHVTSSIHAFELLKRGEISAVMGHRIVCENTKILVNQELRDNKNTARSTLRGLEILPRHIFPPVKLDIWVNTDKLKKRPGTAAKIFHLIDDVMEYIEHNKGTEPFNVLVNKLLKLDELKEIVKNSDKNKKGEKFENQIKDAADVFSNSYYGDEKNPKEYLFMIKTFQTDTMRQLWV